MFKLLMNWSLRLGHLNSELGGVSPKVLLRVTGSGLQDRTCSALALGSLGVVDSPQQPVRILFLRCVMYICDRSELYVQFDSDIGSSRKGRPNRDDTPSAKSHPVFFTFFEAKKLEKFAKVVSSVNLGKLCPVHMQDEWSCVSSETLGQVQKRRLI